MTDPHLPKPGKPAPTPPEPLPDYGENAVGTRFQAGALTFYRVLSVVLAIMAVVSILFLVPAASLSVWAALMAVVVIAALVVSTLNYHFIAAYGRTRPALVITATELQVFVPFNRFVVRLADIQQVSALSRDVMILAPGGIRHGDRASRSKRVVVNNVRSFELDRRQLADLIRERARAAR